MVGVAKDTVRKVLERNNIDVDAALLVNPREIAHSKHRAWGTFPEWLQAHKGKVKLPRSIAELSRVSGCSYDSIRCYLYRRRKVTKELIATLPDLRHLPDLVLEDSSGKQIRSHDILNYRYALDKYTMSVTIFITMPSRTVIRCEIEDLKQFAAVVSDLRRSPWSETGKSSTGLLVAKTQSPFAVRGNDGHPVESSAN